MQCASQCQCQRTITSQHCHNQTLTDKSSIRATTEGWILRTATLIPHVTAVLVTIVTSSLKSTGASRHTHYNTTIMTIQAVLYLYCTVQYCTVLHCFLSSLLATRMRPLLFSLSASFLFLTVHSLSLLAVNINVNMFCSVNSSALHNIIRNLRTFKLKRIQNNLSPVFVYSHIKENIHVLMWSRVCPLLVLEFY